MKAELAQLIALQKTDTNIRRLQAEIESIPERRAEIEKEFDQRAFEIRGLEERRDTASQQRAHLEKEIFEQKQRAERAERNLMAAKKPDEYTAAIREADAARKQISTFETQVLEQMEAFEAAEKELGEREPEVEKLRADMEERFKQFDEQIRVQEAELETARAERERMMKELPKSVSSLFNRISARIRDGIAVAEARNGACTACYMALRPQIMAEVRRGDEVITCDNCNRILYYEPVKATQQAVVS
ncbi:MAG TPA: C4-type zinc ribbon domain-containing protein [Pyrinomonadaceae bacterium]|nr:C4-type zinc ribbon domain-containing protein [Pyrinomonadaceae bacterium]